MVIRGDGHSVCPKGHATFDKRYELAIVLSALLVVTVLLSSSFLQFTGSPSKGEDGDLAAKELRSNTREPAISNPHSQKQSWDWSELVDEMGYVDIIVSWSDQSTKTLGSSSDNGKTKDLMKKLSSGMKVQFSKAYNGFSSRVPLDVLEEIAQEDDQPIKIYPNLEVHATVSDNILEVGADQVWALNDPGGKPVTGLGIVVAIIDTGVDYSHPDLGGGYGPAYKVIGGYDFYNDDADPMDDNGHGTHVAGIVAGKGGMSGVAPDATILAYKVLGQDGSGRMSDVIVAIDRAMDPNDDGDTSDHADVISMSLGGKGQIDDPVCEAVENAVAAGIVVVVAAGNDGPSMGTVSSPGLAPDAITVGAVDNDGVLASFSSRGTSPDLSIKPEISGPGVTITSTVPYANAAHSSPTGYAAMSGTSMATPHVSGGVALLLQMHPTWTPQQVKSAIVSGAAKLDESIWCAGAGGLWLPSAIDSRVFFNPSIVSYGLAGSDPSDVSISNSGSSMTLGFSSIDYCGLSADGEGSLAIWTNISSVSPSSVSVQPGVSVPFSLSVSSMSSSDPEGYYDGELRVSGGSVQTRLPFGFAVLSRLNVHVMDASGREVFDPYGGVWVYSDPSATIAVGIRGSVDRPAPPASFLLPSGDYSAHSMGHQLLYDFSDPYVLSAKFSLNKLETRDVYLNMSTARTFTIDLETDEGLPIFVKDYRVYGRHVGESNISFHLVGSDYSIKGSEIFSLPTSKTIYISDTDLTIGVSISGFSYTSAMWDFMSRNWQHWYEYSNSNSNVFYVESSTDLQYLLAWEFEGIDSATPTTLALVPGQYSVYDTKYDIPGQLVDIWGNWGKHRSIGGDSAFYIRRDTDTSLNSFFSGMTRRTIVQGVFTEVYFPGDLFQGFIEREFYSSDYSRLVRANLASEVYLPDRNFLTPLEGISTVQRIGSGPFYPALRTENTADSLVMYQPILRDQSGSKVGGMALPSMNLYRNGQLLGVYQIAEHLARPDAMRIVSLSEPGTYTARIDYSPVPQICGDVNIELAFTVPAIDMDPPQIAALSMSQRFVPGYGIPITVDARDDKSTPTVNISWRPGSVTSWTALPVSPLGGSSFGATIQTTGTTSTVDVMVTVTDASGNYLQYVATNASARQIPVLFDIAASPVEVGYRNGDAFVVLTGRLSDFLGNPLHPSAGIPIEMTTNGRKIGMLLDEYVGTDSHSHNGTIRFEWHFNPAKIFSGPDETINVDVAFDLGTYEPVHKTITLSSKYYSNPAPVITLISPADGSLIPAGRLIDIGVSDDGAVHVQMRLDGQASAEIQYPYDVDTTMWAEGNHVLEITATDDQLLSSTERFAFHVDRADPVVKILSPTSGSVVPRGWTVTADVSDDHLDQVTYALDNGAPQALASPYAIDMTGWLVGNHSVVIEATDLAGHSASDSTHFEIVERTLVLNLVSPTNGDVVHSGAQITFSVLSFETFTNRWAEYGTWHSLGASTSISTSGWTEGSHVITINSTDAFGGWDEMDVSLVIDDTNPIISLKSPAPQSFVSPSDRLSISVIDDNFKSLTWSLWGQNRTSSSFDVSISLANSPGDGYFTLYVGALDKAGNGENSSFVFAMDSSPPTLEVQGLKDGDAVRSGQALTVVPLDAFLSNVRWSIDSGGESILQSPYTIDTSTFSAGLHSLKLVAADYSGKSCALTMSLYIDAAPPAIVTAFPASVSAGSSFDLSANITDDFKVGRADLYYELKDGGFGSVQMYDTGSAFKVQIASTVSTWNGMIVYIRACDSVGNWAESEHVKLVLTSTSSNDEVPPASGGNPNSWLGQFSFVSWFTTVEGVLTAGILIGMLVLAAGINRRHRRSPEDAVVMDSYSKTRPKEIVEATVRRSLPKIEVTSSTAAASARPAFVDVKPILVAVARKTPEVARHAEVRAMPSLLDAIPAMPIKAVASDVETQDDEDYGALIEQELIIPSLKHSVFSDEVRDLTRELARYVDFEFQTKKHPESARNSPVQ